MFYIIRKDTLQAIQEAIEKSNTSAMMPSIHVQDGHDKFFILHDTLETMADNVRSIKGTSELIPVTELSAEILSISDILSQLSGGGTSAILGVAILGRAILGNSSAGEKLATPTIYLDEVADLEKLSAPVIYLETVNDSNEGTWSLTLPSAAADWTTSTTITGLYRFVLNNEISDLPVYPASNDSIPENVAVCGANLVSYNNVYNDIEGVGISTTGKVTIFVSSVQSRADLQAYLESNPITITYKAEVQKLATPEIYLEEVSEQLASPVISLSLDAPSLSQGIDEFYWSAVDGATHYKISYATSTGTASKTITATSIAVSEMDMIAYSTTKPVTVCALNRQSNGTVNATSPVSNEIFYTETSDGVL